MGYSALGLLPPPVAATFKWPTLPTFQPNYPLQKERSPGSLPGFVWFRVPKTAPQPLANSGGGLELHFLVGICEAYYGDLSWSMCRCPSEQFAKQSAMAVWKHLQFAEERPNIRRRRISQIILRPAGGSWKRRPCSRLQSVGRVHGSSLDLRFLRWTRATCPRVQQHCALCANARKTTIPAG